LFTDIEGSTALLTALGRDRYDELLAGHSRLLRSVFAAHAGRVVDTQGDSFFVAFRTAADAVAAAVDSQRDLAAAEWPGGVKVKVRMGLHTGEPKVGEERYVGIGVHRAARIGAAGHGGQVLLSSTTKELVEEELPLGVAIRDLGERRLKDLEQPQRLYQLDVDGLPSEFAQLRTLDVEFRRRRRRLYAGAALVGVLAAAVAVPLFALGQGSGGGSVVVDGNAVAEIDPGSSRVVGQVPNVGARPGTIVYGSGSLWVANVDDETVSRVDPRTRGVERTVPVQDMPTGLATSTGAVWVVGATGRSAIAVRRIDPRFDVASPVTSIDNVVAGGPASVAAAGNRIWVAPSSGLLSRLDPRSGTIAQRVDPNASPTAVAVGADAVWITDSGADTVTRIDPTGLLTPIAVGHGPSAIAVGAGAVWVVDSLDDAVVRIDADTHAVTTTIPVGRDPAGIAVAAESVWVANRGDGTLTRIDPSGSRRPETIEVGGSPQAVAAADGRVWVTVDRQALVRPAAASEGGVARVNLQQDIGQIDPALTYAPESWRLLYATCAKLLNYPDKPAPEGSQLEPEVARTLPTRSSDGKTYTFTIRPGFRFSPPSNAAVTAQTFKYTIERSLNPRMTKVSGIPNYFADVVGESAYTAGRARHITGVVVHGNKLIIRLRRPVPDLPARLAMPFFCVVPTGTPVDPQATGAVPSAGPYYVASYTPGQGLVLERNPNYRGERPHRLARIEVAFGVSKERTDDQIEAGVADYALDGAAPADIPRLLARYGRGSAAARQHRQQLFENASTGLDFFALNTRRPLFRDARLRRAANYAIDRTALARIGNWYTQTPDQATDDYLPPGVPGFRTLSTYPLRSDLAAARRLAGPQRHTAILYTCNVSPCDRLAEVVKANLAAIGIDVQVKAFGISTLYTRVSRPGEPYDLAYGQWIPDYPDPYPFLNLLLENGIFAPFDEPPYAQELRTAAKLSGPERYLAYEKLQPQLARKGAPWITYGDIPTYDFFSARIGCQLFNPVYGIDLAALCIRNRPGR
jgi:YVTN family beta-propeller protein